MKKQSNTYNPFAGHKFEPSLWSNPDSYKQDDNKMKGQSNAYNLFSGDRYDEPSLWSNHDNDKQNDKQDDNKMKGQFNSYNYFEEDKQDDNKIKFTFTYHDVDGYIETYDCKSEEELMHHYKWFCEHRDVIKSSFGYTNDTLTHISIVANNLSKKQNWNRIGTPFLWARKGLVAVIDTQY